MANFLVLHKSSDTWGLLDDYEWNDHAHLVIDEVVASIGALCVGQITDSFAREALEAADIVVVSYDTQGMTRQSIRGFAALEAHDDVLPRYIYIDLICNAVRPGALTRAAAATDLAAKRTMKGGSSLLKVIEGIARQGKYAYIKLKALEHVIPYYYHFGWRFISGCPPKDDGMADAVTRLSAVYAAIRRRNKPGVLNTTIEEDDAISEALVPFRRFLLGLHSDAAVSSYRARDEDDDEAGTREQHLARLRDDGYLMIKCLGRQGGGKRRKRRRKKKKSRRPRRRKRRRRSRRRHRRRAARGPIPDPYGLLPDYMPPSAGPPPEHLPPYAGPPDYMPPAVGPPGYMEEEEILSPVSSPELSPALSVASSWSPASPMTRAQARRILYPPVPPKAWHQMSLLDWWKQRKKKKKTRKKSPPKRKSPTPSPTPELLISGGTRRRRRRC